MRKKKSPVVTAEDKAYCCSAVYRRKCDKLREIEKVRASIVCTCRRWWGWGVHFHWAWDFGHAGFLAASPATPPKPWRKKIGRQKCGDKIHCKATKNLWLAEGWRLGDQQNRWLYKCGAASRGWEPTRRDEHARTAFVRIIFFGSNHGCVWLGSTLITN